MVSINVIFHRETDRGALFLYIKKKGEINIETTKGARNMPGDLYHIFIYLFQYKVVNNNNSPENRYYSSKVVASLIVSATK